MRAGRMSEIEFEFEVEVEFEVEFEVEGGGDATESGCSGFVLR
jgi:hypothetical protein